MTKKKIKVVDVVDNDKKDDEYTVIVDEITSNEVSDDKVESVKENTDEKLETIKEEQEEKTSITEVSEPIESTKKIREQELVKCNKCNKWVTPKTMKYTHSNTCGIVKKTKPKKTILNEHEQEYKSPNPVNKETAEVDKSQSVLQKQQLVPTVKEVVKSYEDMRKDRLKERLKQRDERNKLLFKQVLQ